eukprot:6252865-Amphidinium_carterae.1
MTQSKCARCWLVCKQACGSKCIKHNFLGLMWPNDLASSGTLNPSSSLNGMLRPDACTVARDCDN